jgi:hypothetical protein
MHPRGATLARGIALAVTAALPLVVWPGIDTPFSTPKLRLLVSGLLAAGAVWLWSGDERASPRSRELIWILLAQRGARAMGDLMMHANRWTLDEAARFAVEHTPRGWLRIDGATVWGEQQLYLQQPAYGTSYLVGKVQIDELMGEVAAARGATFSLPAFMDDFQAAGMVPVALIRREMLPAN